MKISEVWRENRPPRSSGPNPPPNKGILAKYRAIKREEAEKRNEEYRALVEATARNHNISEKEAKRIVQALSRAEKRKAAKNAK